MVEEAFLRTRDIVRIGYARRLAALSVEDETRNVTALLLASRDGDEAALERLMPLVHAELHRSHGGAWPASRPATLFSRRTWCTRRSSGWSTFAASRGRTGRTSWPWPRGSCGACSSTLPARRAHKRGAGAAHVTFRDDLPAAAASDGLDLVILDDALDELARLDERKARGVELRFFGGLTVDEIALCLDVSSGLTSSKRWV